VSQIVRVLSAAVAVFMAKNYSLFLFLRPLFPRRQKSADGLIKELLGAENSPFLM
jgi:hypothetical protein